MTRRSFLPYLLALIIFAVYSYLLRFGLSFFGDFGFSVANYKYFYSNPESTYFWFANWVTLFAGGTIYELFSDYGLQIFFTACAFIYAVNFLLVDEIVRTVCQKKHSFIVFCSALFVASGSQGYLNRYSLTALFLTLTVFLIVKFIYTTKNRYLYLSGFFTGIMIFVRLPNLAAVGFCLPLLFVADLKKSIKYIACFLGCTALGIAAVFCAAFLMGNYEVFIQGLWVMLAKVVAPSTGHNVAAEAHTSASILSFLFIDSFKSLAVGFPVSTAIASCYYFGGKKISLRQSVLPLCAALLASAALLYLAYTILEMRFVHRYLFSGVLTSLGLFIILASKDRKLQLTLLAALIAPYVAVFGSASGITRNISGLWTVLPLLLCVAYEGFDSKDNRTQRIVRLCFVSGVICLGMAMWAKKTSFYARKALAPNVCEEKYSKLYAPKNEVKEYQYELDNIKANLKGHKYGLIFQQAGLIHYYLDLIPYTGSTDPTFWQYNLAEILDKSKKEFGLPVIIKSCVELKLLGLEASHNEFMKFIAENNYKEVWKSNNFTVYLPE